MVKCPKCRADIDELVAYSLEENRQTVSLDEQENLDWSISEPVDESCVQIEFECPECNAVIYKNKGWSNDPQIKAILTEKQ